VTGRSDVHCQPSGHTKPAAELTTGNYRFRAEEETELLNVGDQALMRGLVTAFPSFRPGLSLSYCGRRQSRPQNVQREFPCRCSASTFARSIIFKHFIYHSCYIFKNSSSCPELVRMGPKALHCHILKPGPDNGW
jgi:hypothetical protein